MKKSINVITTSIVVRGCNSIGNAYIVSANNINNMIIMFYSGVELDVDGKYDVTISYHEAGSLYRDSSGNEQARKSSGWSLDMWVEL